MIKVAYAIAEGKLTDNHGAGRTSDPMTARTKYRSTLNGIFEGFDSPEDRFAVGGKIAGIGFLIIGLTAIPISLINTPVNPAEPWLIGGVIIYGIICLLVPWQRVNKRLLVTIPALATAVVAFATVVGTPVYALAYIFIGVVIALTGTRIRLVGHLTWITIALGLTAMLDPDDNNLMVTIALLEIPMVWLMSLITFHLVQNLDQSKTAFEDLSRQDGLTGVWNYRALHEYLSDRLDASLRGSSQFALILIDLDGFKLINEEHGHLGGDRVLAHVGETLRSSVRSIDLVFRQGGDEFAVVVPDMNAEEADEIAIRLSERLRHKTGERISACHGVAVYPGDGVTIDQLLSQADLALLTKKRLKREVPPSSRPAVPQA